MPFWNSKGKEDPKNEKESHSVKPTEPAYTRDEILICATYGNIYAVQKINGLSIWHKKFPTGVMGRTISLFITDTDKLIVAGMGRTVCMDLFDGTVIWINRMIGFGSNEVTVLSTPSRFLPPKKYPDEERTSNDPPDYNEKEETPGTPIIIAASRGRILAMDSLTGKRLWSTFMLGGGIRIPTTLIDPPSVEEGRARGLLYAGGGRVLYCLDVKSGYLLWKKEISNCSFGYGFMTMATPWSSRLAAETYTAFSQNPVAQVRDHQRDIEKSGNQ